MGDATARRDASKTLVRYLMEPSGTPVAIFPDIEVGPGVCPSTSLTAGDRPYAHAVTVRLPPARPGEYRELERELLRRGMSLAPEDPYAGVGLLTSWEVGGDHNVGETGPVGRTDRYVQVVVDERADGHWDVSVFAMPFDGQVGERMGKTEIPVMDDPTEVPLADAERYAFDCVYNSMRAELGIQTADAGAVAGPAA